MVGFNNRQVIEIIDHQAGRLRDALFRQVGGEIQLFQNGTIA